MKTRRLETTERGLAEAAEILRAGGRVAFPTETVYGLGADARQEAAVAGIYAAKGRPSFNPLIVHLPDLEAARDVAEVSKRAEMLAAQFWPGALTLVLPLRLGAGISPLVTAGLDTVAVRVPAHPVARALLHRFGGPVAAPSANPSGQVSPTRPAHVLAGLDGRIDAVVEGGFCPVGVESTILSLTDDAPRLLRPGGVTLEALEAALDARLAEGGEAGPQPIAPGQLASHYAPDAPVRLNATLPDAGEVWLGFGTDCPGAVMSLSETGDLDDAAAGLFHALRAMDALAAGRRIAVAPIPEAGLGRAIKKKNKFKIKVAIW